MADLTPTPTAHCCSHYKIPSARSSFSVMVLLFTGAGAIVPVAAEAGEESSKPSSVSPAVLKQKVQQLVEKLDSNSFQIRRSAEGELLKLGPQVLPFLPPPELAPTISVREAVRRLRVRLEYRKASESVRPSRITLKKTLPLSELLKDISAQTGNRIHFADLKKDSQKKLFAVRFEEETFWSAMDHLAARSGFQIAEHAASGALKLVPSPAGSPSGKYPVTYSGPFRIAVHNAALKPLRGDPQHRLLRIELEITAEPRLRPLFVKYSGRDISASTPQFRPAPFNPEAKYELPLGEAGKSLMLQNDFTVPVSTELKQVNLRGRLSVKTAAGSERFEFGNLSREKRRARRKGGVTVMLRKATFRPTDEGTQKAEIHISVSYDTGGPAFESHRTWIFHNRVVLETKDGKRIEPNGPFSTERQADGAVAVGYSFNNLRQDPSAYRFVYVAPTLILDVPVEFEIQNVPVTTP